MTMDIFARAKTQQAARKGGAAPTEPAPAADKKAAARAAANPKPAAKPAINSAPPPAVETASNGAPWADPKCPACKGLGINSKGRACPICDKTALKRGTPTSSMYVIELSDGAVTAVLREEHADSGAEEAWAGDVPVAGAPAPKAATKPAAASAAVEPEVAEDEATEAPEEDPGTEAPEVVEAVEEPAPPKAARPTTRDAARAALTRQGDAPAPAAPAPKQPKPAAASKPAAAPKPVATEPARAAGRPRVGLTILIGAAQLKGPERPTLMASELLERVGAELAADMGAASYWELDAFKRRERIRQRSAEIAESLGKTVLLMGSTNDPDIVSMVNGLAAAPATEAVYEGLR